MTLVDRVLGEPELLRDPPVLVDVGAAGGIHRPWRSIARHAIGVGFEPDARDAAALAGAATKFRRWVMCPGLVLPRAAASAPLHLTVSPQCSSTLRPRMDRLGDWAFADFFRVVETRSFPATTLSAGLLREGIERVDWLKCDTQGLDLGIYQSLPAEWRARLVAVEFEPGIIDAYEGEDKLATVLAAMQAEPFWLAELQVGRMARGSPEMLARHLGATAPAWARRLGPFAPAWTNLLFLREPPALSGRRAYLLGWVFSTISGQHGSALAIAEAGTREFGGALFTAMTRASVRRLRWAMLRALPGWIWRRLTAR